MSKAFMKQPEARVNQMELNLGIIAVVLGVGICAAGGLLSAWAARRREGVDEAAEERPKPAERHR